MSDNLPDLAPDSVAVIEISTLSPTDRVEKARLAHRKHVLGWPPSRIGKHLGLSEQTAIRLIEEELVRANTNRPNPGHLARARMQYIIESASEVLESGSLKDSAMVRPQLLRMMLDAQDKLDKYDGVEAPKRSEHVHLDLAALAREAVRQEKESRGTIDAEVIDGE